MLLTVTFLYVTWPSLSTLRWPIFRSYFDNRDNVLAASTPTPATPTAVTPTAARPTTDVLVVTLSSDSDYTHARARTHTHAHTHVYRHTRSDDSDQSAARSFLWQDDFSFLHYKYHRHHFSWVLSGASCKYACQKAMVLRPDLVVNASMSTFSHTLYLYNTGNKVIHNIHFVCVISVCTSAGWDKND